MSAMMYAEDYLDGEYDFSVMHDKMTGVAKDAIDDTGVWDDMDVFSVIEGGMFPGGENPFGILDNSTFERCPSRYWKQGNNVQCQREKGHRGNHEY